MQIHHISHDECKNCGVYKKTQGGRTSVIARYWSNEA
jgi:hypothetical protein